MPDLLTVGAGIADGLQKASQNLLNIAMAKHKMKQDNELFQIEKKQKDLEIKKAEYLLSPDQLQLMTDEHKAKVAAYNAQQNLAQIHIATAQMEELRKVDNYTKAQQIVDGVLSGKVKIPQGMRLSLGSGYGVSQSNPPGKTGTVINLGDETPTPSGNDSKDANDFLSQF